MSTTTLKYQDKNPLQRDGTNQAQRFPDMLMPDAVKLHAFTVEDWMKFAYEFAAYVGYFDVQDDINPKGNWQKFFINHNKIEKYLSEVDNQNTEPHLALFIAFLKLMMHSQDELNSLTKRHLDFYYKEVLQLKNKPFTPDRVYLVFELAKNIVSEIVPEGTLLNAGKDDAKKTIHFATEEELVINAAAITAIKSLIHVAGEKIGYADVANSKDGIGTALEDETWYAFGHNVDNEKHVPLPDATIGFALAANILYLKEGIRNISIKLELGVLSSFTVAPFNNLNEKVKLFLTTEKEWLEVAPTMVSVTKTDTITATINLVIDLDNSVVPIVAYDKKVHGESFNTNLPIVRILFDTNTAYEEYLALSKASVIKSEINVDVKEVKDIQAENDMGVITPSKPFYPFSTQPKVGSNFYIGCNEIFSKNFSDVSIEFKWKDKPQNLKDHYIAYQTAYLNNNLTAEKYTIQINANSNLENAGNPVVANDNYFKVNISHIQDGVWHYEYNKRLFNNDDLTIAATAAQTKNYTTPIIYNTQNSANKYVIQKYLQLKPVIVPLFNFNPGFLNPIKNNTAFNAKVKDGFFRLTLQNDFLHKHYARLYAIAMSKDNKSIVIPNEPYTPIVEEVKLSYKAKSVNNFIFPVHENNPINKLKNYSQREIQLFQELPFGQREQHIFLKDQFGNKLQEINKAISLLPTFNKEGYCYLGINKAIPGQQVSVLFSVAEGSENPLAPSFTDERKIEWSYMVNNEWLPLTNENILKDSTNNFLKTGIITFILPADITDQNTAMPNSLMWLRAELPDGLSYNSVCRFVDIKAQVVSSVFFNQNNSLSHLRTALPHDSISKFIDKPIGVKKVMQPYPSFGGADTETDKDYYIRVSERLRHKNRAVNIWDYERLILNQFPKIYKVKCLNHTAATPNYFELTPGCVTVIPIPDVSNKNLYDILQPRVSSNTLREIEQYISDLMSGHIDFKAEHPVYEPVLFQFKVKFYKHYDIHTYTKILNEELIKFLAPWSYDNEKQILFGGKIYKSVVITHIEDLPFVDYVTDFKMKIDSEDNTFQSMLQASNAKSILTSVKEHIIIPLLTDAECINENDYSISKHKI